MHKSMKTVFLLSAFLMILSSSCSIALPSRISQKSETTIHNNAPQIEPLKRKDYTVLRQTKGKASTNRYYILFFPVGKYKSNEELYENAYDCAVGNLPDADALILPRQKTKKLTIPLILLNYNRRTVTVTGVGISVKDKIFKETQTLY
jgi:hypothetical protein